ncbi:RNA polymerase II elongation factor ELL isoform X2 [Myripristis murdjan]|uniref:RNA polymerase II elongation factor ELL isoform X2 n=1 Tax=Myripristis murdjan TaxID=586833 RepID=UPI00117649D4|nr:RNA polymerase II elongation factor ELL isoform X2 [Myripristis murdjan]
MAALKEEQCYGLSCGRVSNGSNVSVFHVKLTDSALRAFEGYQSSKGLSSQPLIRFTGNQGKISIPRSDNPNELRTFTFYLSNVGRDNPQGSFDCIQQYITSEGSIQLDCLGGIQDKITVCATDDSYQKARQSMAQAEEETRSRGAIVIKPGGRYVGKKVQIRKPAPGLSDIAPSRRTSRPVIISSSTLKKSTTQQRPLRERLTHLLALKPYKKPELILRLQKDGLSQSDKDSLDSHLQQVANLNARDNTFTLKDSLFKDIQKDWPGYTEGDQQLLKRILVRKLCQAQSTPAPPAETPMSPPKELASNSPSQKRPAADFIDPLANKKPRISHLASKAAAAPINGKLSSSNGREASGTQAGAAVAVSASDSMVTSISQPLPLLDIPRPYDPLSDVSNDSSHNGRDCESQELAVSERLGQPLSAFSGSMVLTVPSIGTSSPGLTALDGPRDKSPSSLHGKSKKKSKKHKDKEKTKEREREQEKEKEKERKAGEEQMPEPDQACEISSSPENLKSNSIPHKSTDLNGMCNSTSIRSSSSDMADYLTKYTVIGSQEQRQSYKNDFNAEYSEYRGLHARIEGITRQFTVLDSELKQLQQGTDKYKTIHNQILQEYRKIKKTNPNYSQEKNRCEYLHNKLAHIKKLIAEYDQQQLQNWQTGAS